MPRRAISAIVGRATRSTTSSTRSAGAHGSGRVRAHAAGVGALVAVVRALEVLRGDQRHDVDAVGQDEQRDLGAVEVVLDDDAAVGLGQARLRVGQRLGAVVGHDDALARGEPVVLDHVGGAERVETRGGLLDRRRHPRLGGGHARGGHDLLGERLGALEPGARGGRAEDGDPDGPHGVRDARDQRRLGPDDDEVRVERCVASAATADPSSWSTACSVASAPMPGLPGAACSAVTAGSRDSARTSACSRAPVPTTRIFTGREPTGRLRRARRRSRQPRRSRPQGVQLVDHRQRQPVTEPREELLGQVALRQPRRGVDREQLLQGARRQVQPVRSSSPSARAARRSASRSPPPTRRAAAAPRPAPARSPRTRATGRTRRRPCGTS